MDPMEYIVPNRKRLPYGMMNFAVIRREDYYYVDKNGVMATSGWVYWDYNYYYPRSWGGMYKNAFITYDNNLYYLGSDSKMAIGWQSIGGNTYYFRSWGGMITGK